MKMQKIKLLSAVTLALAVPAAPVAAGPTWEFGPDYEGVLKLDYKGQFQASARDIGSGSDGDDTTTEFNFFRNRIALMGAYGDHFSLYVQTEFHEDNNIYDNYSFGPGVGDGENNNFQMLDAVMRFRYNDSLNLWLGKFKHALVRENLEGCFTPLSLDRSIFQLTPMNEERTRTKGVELWGNLFEERFQYRALVSNGRNDSTLSPDSEFRYTLRGHVSLLDPESSHGYKGTYIGEKKVLTIGAGYEMENDIAYDDVTGQTGAVDYEGWTADLFFEYPVEDAGTFTFSTAYADYDLDDAYQGADPDRYTIGHNGEKNGGYTKIGYMLPNYPLQFFARGENWSFAELNGIVDQEIDWYAGGLNYYFRGQDLKLTLEYSNNDFDKEDADNEDFDTVTAQLQLQF